MNEILKVLIREILLAFLISTIWNFLVVPMSGWPVLSPLLVLALLSIKSLVLPVTILARPITAEERGSHLTMNMVVNAIWCLFIWVMYVASLHL